MLSPDLLDLLRQWWLVKRSRGWLFPGQQLVQPITTRQLDRACRDRRAGRPARQARVHAHAPA